MMMSGISGIGGMAMMSDVRLKKNIRRLGPCRSGLFFRYKWEWNDVAKALGFNYLPTTGVIAQEVMRYAPNAVHKTASGYYCIDYELLNRIEDARTTS